MARRRIIEGTWTCAECSTAGIRGRDKVCPGCGSPREAAEASFDFGGTTASGASTAPTVTSPEALDVAGAGADWHCVHCGAANQGDGELCVQCSAPRLATRASEAVEDLTETAVKVGGAGLGLLTAGMGALMALCTGVCGVNAWLNRDVQVEATVVERTWVRKVEVERLEPAPAEGWKDELPAPAGLPGSGALTPGRGEILGCETRKCWPRPPEGETTARIAGLYWMHERTLKKMSRHPGEGWRDRVPTALGAMPAAGGGGWPGREGKPVCSRKERTPEKCRTEQRREQCGTVEKCTVKDLENGFAEEVCVDEPKYCQVDHEVCDPAVFADWCTWTELRWDPAQVVKAEGTDSRPVDPPGRSPGADESLTWRRIHTIRLEPLAGPPRVSVDVPTDAFRGRRIGELVYAGRSVAPVPARLIPPVPPRGAPAPERIDCGDAVPRDVLGTRDRCRYTRWSWNAMPPLVERGENAIPDWPDGELGQDGRETRSEWLEVELAWARGDKKSARRETLGVEQWESWPLGRVRPVVVDRDGAFVQWGDGP